MLDHTPDSTVIDFSALRRAITRAIPWILASAFSISAATYCVLSMLTPSFTSDAQVLIGGKGFQDPFREAKDNRVNGAAVAAAIDKEAVLSQVKVLQSSDLAAVLIKEFKLDANPQFNKALQPPGAASSISQSLGLGSPTAQDTDEDLVQRAYYKALQVSQAKDTRVIGIEFTTTDRQLSAELSNRLAELYISWLTDQTVKQTTGASTWLAAEIDRLRREVKQAEADVEDFRAGKGLFGTGPDKLTLDSQQLAELSAELGRIKSERSSTESRSQIIRAMVRGGGGEAAPDVLKSPLVQRLVEQRARIERQASELGTNLMPGHPRMKQLRGDLDGLNRLIKGEVGKVAQSLEREAEASGLREAAVKDKLDEMKRRVQHSSTDEVKLRDLEREAKSKRETLEYYLARHADASARQDVRAVQPEAEIISRARPSSVPAFPKKLPMTILSATAALLLGFAWITTCELLSGPQVPPALASVSSQEHGRVTSLHTTQNSQRLPPENGLYCRQPRTPALRLPASHTSMTTVGCHILKQSLDRPAGYRTLISGDGPLHAIDREARELARILGQAGKEVILVALDTVAPDTDRIHHVPKKCGLYDLVAGRGSLVTAITSEPGTPFHVLGAGSVSATVLAREPHCLEAILEGLCAAYDHVIISGSKDAARDLFDAAGKRFDIGLEITQSGWTSDSRAAARFLGLNSFAFEFLRLARTHDLDLRQGTSDIRVAHDVPCGPARAMTMRGTSIHHV